ncbi:unnamed protein product [Plutella xylostella]|uniref:(diamondback moth) hypothetical protein n=1 Tax=Plutella xylostella TaxID=51655 RepID=A0A8S4E7W8_PLUXY|nr:unnamed protein product [Plutella xylostella]
MTQTLSDDGSSSGDHVMQINKDDFEQLHGPPCSLGKICLFVDLYKTLINACNNLVNAIKYQVSVEERPLHVARFAVFLGGNVASLLGPCACCERLRAGARALRKQLASALVGNRLDKRSRVSARALLALTGAHGLGVSLLGMLRVDISLPLHYVSLLVTYLIILLQFQKVIGNNIHV